MLGDIPMAKPVLEYFTNLLESRQTKAMASQLENEYHVYKHLIACVDPVDKWAFCPKPLKKLLATTCNICTGKNMFTIETCSSSPKLSGMV